MKNILLLAALAITQCSSGQVLGDSVSVYHIGRHYSGKVIDVKGDSAVVHLTTGKTLNVIRTMLVPIAPRERGNFRLLDGEVIFQKIYADAADSANTIAMKLMLQLPTTPNITNVTDNGILISANYDKPITDSLVGAVKGQETANISIEVEDGKYRVTLTNILDEVTDIYTPTYSDIYSYTAEYTQDKGTEWNSAADTLKKSDTFQPLFILKKTTGQKF